MIHAQVPSINLCHGCRGFRWSRGPLWAGGSSRRGAGAPVYHFYIGSLHSHTSYSDGVGTPADAFEHARDQAHVDFLAVTDHNCTLSPAEYADVLAQAEAFTQDGVFVAIGGQEWTGYEGSHCTVLEADHIFPYNPYDFQALYQELLESGSTGAICASAGGDV